MIKKIKKIFLLFSLFLFLYTMFFNLPTALLTHNIINQISYPNDCDKFKNKTLTEINNYFLNLSPYTKWHGGYFLISCDIKNSGVIVYNNLNIVNKFRKNPYDFLGLEIDASTKNIFEVEIVDKQLTQLFKIKIMPYKSLSLNEKKERIEQYWPKIIENQLNIKIKPIFLEDWAYK